MMTLEATIRFENLFRYEGFDWQGRSVGGLAQFRFGATFGVCISI
jgi:hypothetical protein